MKSIFVVLFLLIGLIAANGQNEQAPILEKEFAYKDWTYKTVRSDDEINLRKFVSGKKLVMVVYYAPWCPNWKHDAPFVQRLYDTYKGNGFDIIAVAEYDPLDAMKKNLDAFKVTFPAVYESELRTDREKTTHYEFRKSAGDTRKWGSPWYIFIEPKNLEKDGDALLKKASIVNGELIEAEAEKFIRAKLGLPVGSPAIAAERPSEICEPETKTANLVRP